VKIALLLTALLVVLLLSVLVIGALLPKHHVASRSAAFRASPERLFSFIAGAQDWRPEVTHCEALSDPSGRELLRETTRDGQTITYEVLDKMPPRSLRRRIVTARLPYSGTWTFSLEPRGEVTVVRITEDGEVYNPVFRFVSRFALGYTRTLDAYLRALAKATGQPVELGN
jgi:hypothetical protein